MQQQWFLYLRSKMNDQQNATTIFLMPPCINLFELNKRLPAPHLPQLLSPSLPVTLLPSRDWKPVWLPEQIAALTEMKERESRRFMCHLPLFDARAHTPTHTQHKQGGASLKVNTWTSGEKRGGWSAIWNFQSLPSVCLRTTWKAAAANKEPKKTTTNPPPPSKKENTCERWSGVQR